MPTSRPLAWIALVICLAVAGCGSSDPPPSSDPCSPAAGAGLDAMEPCDPLAQTCGTGMGCYDQAPVGACPFECVAIFGLGVGPNEPCQYLNDCEPGLVCIGPEFFRTACTGAGCCAEFCDLDAPSCAGGGECRPYLVSGEVPPGLEHVGVCVGS